VNRGVMTKTWREIRWITLFFGLGLAVLELLLTYIIPTAFGAVPAEWFQVSFFQDFLKGLLGTQIGDVVGPRALTSLPWVHPVALALLWAHEIAICTQLPAGETDRGTIDVLLGLPVSRTRAYLSVTVVWLAAGLFVVAMGFAGNMIGSSLAPPDFRSPIDRVLIVVANLLCLYVAVGGFACMVSTLSNHRGRAIGLVFAVVLASFFLSVLAPMWEPARSISFLSVLNYYRPMTVLAGSSPPAADMLVLVTTGAVFWAVGAGVFARRNICTV